MKKPKKRLKKPKIRYSFQRHALFRCPGPKVLAKLLQCSLAHLERLAADTSVHYNVWDRLDENKKARRIEEPLERMRAIHLRLGNLLLKLDTPEYLHSGLRGRSIRSNASAHLTHDETFKLDIRKFYPSTLRAHVFEFFHLDLEMQRDCAGLLAKLCTFEGHVPTGSLLSQMLAFWSHRRLFDAIDLYARRRGGVFTLYVDDLTLSFDAIQDDDLRSIARLIGKRGLIAHKAQLYRRGQVRMVTGAILRDGRLLATNSLRHRIFKTHAELRQSNNHLDRLAKARQLAGRLNAAAFIEPAMLGKAEAAQALVRHLS